ncbi:radical SAM protein [Streptomyces xiamenensis]|uniref:radical SAM protein n=1 Tax=Streptomyces xiamenensis TaxID=408015 RepID=UPI0036ED1121
MQEITFTWLEITGQCQLACDHCYASSGPLGTHGSMLVEDWKRVIGQLADHGVTTVQFIGGEPTLHPGFPELLTCAVEAGMGSEVFTNLSHVKDQWWDLYGHPAVSLATSFYSDQAAEHEAITTGRGSYVRTKANIAEAVRRGIPLRAGIIDVKDGQRVVQARQELESLGVTEIGVDRLRQVGRGIRSTTPSVAQLCGNCAQGVAAISPEGWVWPCVFARWLPVGNVRTESVSAILSGSAMSTTADELAARFAAQRPCVPQMCNPQCGPSCSPACAPQSNCRPTQTCAPNYTCGPCAPKDQACAPERECRPNQCRPTR